MNNNFTIKFQLFSLTSLTVILSILQVLGYISIPFQLILIPALVDIAYVTIWLIILVIELEKMIDKL